MANLDTILYNSIDQAIIFSNAILSHSLTGHITWWPIFKTNYGYDQSFIYMGIYYFITKYVTLHD